MTYANASSKIFFFLFHRNGNYGLWMKITGTQQWMKASYFTEGESFLAVWPLRQHKGFGQCDSRLNALVLLLFCGESKGRRVWKDKRWCMYCTSEARLN